MRRGANWVLWEDHGLNDENLGVRLANNIKRLIFNSKGDSHNRCSSFSSKRGGDTTTWSSACDHNFMGVSGNCTNASLARRRHSATIKVNFHYTRWQGDPRTFISNMATPGCRGEWRETLSELKLNRERRGLVVPIRAHSLGQHRILTRDIDWLRTSTWFVRRGILRSGMR